MKKITLFLVTALLILTFCSCAENIVAPKVNLTDVMSDIEEQIKLPADMMTVSNTEMLKNYYGIEAEDVVSFEIRMNSSGVEQDEIVMIEAKDEEAAERIEEALDRRLDDKENQMKNYLPEEYQMLEKCDVEQEGVYVSMFLSDDAQKMEQIYNSYFNK